MIDNIALECAKEYGFDAVDFVGDLEGTKVYEPYYKSGKAFIGYARYVLVKDGKATMTGAKEGEEVCQKLYAGKVE